MYGFTKIYSCYKTAERIVMKSIKKALSLFLSLAFVLSAFSFGVFAQSDEVASGTCGSNMTWTLDEEGTLTITGTGDMKNYLDSYPWPYTIKKVIIQDGVTSIAMGAFSNCEELESVEIANTVVTIHSFAFQNCSSLKSITIPESVEKINQDVFKWCNSLTEINVSENNKAYSSADAILFNKDKTELVYYSAGKSNSEYSIPETVLTIGRGAFSWSSLESIEIPDSVVEISDKAFSECINLKTISIGNSVEKIGFEAFYFCSELQNLVFPDSLKTIDSQAFMFCRSLESVSFGNSLETIGSKAFWSCTNLSSVVFNSVKTIDSYAFASCTSIKELKFPETLINIEESAFFECTSLEKITLPNSLKTVGTKAFNLCDNLTSVTIPESVTVIGEGAFGYASFIENIKIDGFTITGAKDSAAERYATDNGFVFVCADTDASDDYYINKTENTLPNVAERTSVSEVISALANKGVNVTLTDKDGNLLADEKIVGTGCKVKTDAGDEYTVIVSGDIDGTGTVSTSDYLGVKSALLGNLELSDEYLKAADTDNSGELSVTDYVKIKSYFLGIFDLYA